MTKEEWLEKQKKFDKVNKLHITKKQWNEITEEEKEKYLTMGRAIGVIKQGKFRLPDLTEMNRFQFTYGSLILHCFTNKKDLATIAWEDIKDILREKNI